MGPQGPQVHRGAKVHRVPRVLSGFTGPLYRSEEKKNHLERLARYQAVWLAASAVWSPGTPLPFQVGVVLVGLVGWVEGNVWQ